MWQVLKSEWNYHRMFILYLITVSTLSFISIQFYPLYTGKPIILSNAGIISQGHIYFNFLGMILVSLSLRPNRNRHCLSLPISIWKIGLLRIFFYLSYWLLLVIFYLLFTQISENYLLNRTTLMILGTQTGIILIIYSVFFMGMDTIKSMKKGKLYFHISLRKWFGLLVGLLILSVSFLVISAIVMNYQNRGSSPIDRFLLGLYRSPTGTFSLLGIGMILIAASTYVFINRASYTE